MRLVVLAETADGERRVAAVPETVRAFIAAGWDVAVQRGSGRGAFFPDEAYEGAGATIVDGGLADGLDDGLGDGLDDDADVVRGVDLVLSVRPAPLPTLRMLAPGTAIVSLLAPGTYGEHVQGARDRGLTAFALELVPRITRAQTIDVLSSQALVAGYRAALAAADRLPGLLPMFTTAAGTIPAAEVLILGTGVAGLSAIATVRRLGAAVSAYDIRPSSADEVRSLGATVLPLELGTDEGVGGYARVQSDEFLAAQRSLLAEHIGNFDAVITTAAVPGRPAPLLVTTEMIERMRPGSVVVDLAAETGGNCELTSVGEEVEHAGVVVYGPRNIESGAARHASELFSRNVLHLVLLMTRNGTFAPDFEDEVLAGCCVTRVGAGPVDDPVRSRGRSLATDPASVRRGTVADVAEILRHSRTVAVVPGYGLAAAQAQYAVREFAEVLQERGVVVTYALHPVAGRMPGHLNVLLAAAGVPDASLRGLAEANEEFPQTDVVIVIGANDVVNPSARTSTGSPLSGMPVLDVDSARDVVVLKRSLQPGFADVENPLFSDPRTTMLFGDVRGSVTRLVTAMRSA